MRRDPRACDPGPREGRRLEASLAHGATAALDPALGWTLRALLAGVFLRACVGKLRAPRAFARAVEGYALLPGRVVPVATGVLLALEGALVPALLVPVSAAAACLAAAALLGAYTFAIVVNLRRGRRDIDCGCAGPARRQTLHELLVVRNLALVAAALVAMLAPGTRALGWLDAVTIAASLVALLALVAALEGLAANAARGAARRPRPIEAAG